MAEPQSTDAVLVEADGPVRLVTLNRPDTLNATDAELHHTIPAVWEELATDQDAHAVVLTGAGTAFSAGGSFGLLQEMVDDVDVRAAIMDEAKTLVRSMLAIEIPIIAGGERSAGGARLQPGVAVRSRADRRGCLPDGSARSRSASSPRTAGRSRGRSSPGCCREGAPLPRLAHLRGGGGGGGIGIAHLQRSGRRRAGARPPDRASCRRSRCWRPSGSSIRNCARRWSSCSTTASRPRRAPSTRPSSRPTWPGSPARRS